MSPELLEMKDLFKKAIGTLVVMYFGSIITLAVWIIKQAYKKGYEKAEIDFKIKDAKDCAVRAHKDNDEQDAKIDRLEQLAFRKS